MGLDPSPPTSRHATLNTLTLKRALLVVAYLLEQTFSLLESAKNERKTARATWAYAHKRIRRVLQCVAVFCGVIVAVCCSVSQCVAVLLLQCVAVCRSVSQCVAVCCSVLQCVAVCRGVIVAVCCSLIRGKRPVEHGNRSLPKRRRT